MPTFEPIQSTNLPKEVEKPIPTRTAVTRTVPRNTDRPLTQETPGEVLPAAESVKLSPQLSALAKKEQAYRQREQALKEREKQLEERLSKADKYSQLQEKLTAKDFSAAEELGLSYEEYTKYLLDKEGSGESDPNADRIKALEAKLQDFEKAGEERANKEYEETVAEYRTEIKRLIESSDEFPKLKKSGEESQKAVLQLILDSWEEDDVLLSVEEAAREVDSYLGEEAKKWAALIAEEPRAEEQKTLPKVQRTLNQTMQPSGIEKRVEKSLQHLPDQERYAEAMRRIQARRLTQGR